MHITSSLHHPLFVTVHISAVTLPVLDTSTARQPHGRNWMWKFVLKASLKKLPRWHLKSVYQPRKLPRL